MYRKAIDFPFLLQVAIHKLRLQEEGGRWSKKTTFCKLLYHRKCKRRRIGGQKKTNVVNIVCDRPLSMLKKLHNRHTFTPAVCSFGNYFFAILISQTLWTNIESSIKIKVYSNICSPFIFVLFSLLEVIHLVEDR